MNEDYTELNLKKNIKFYEGLKKSCTNKTGVYQPRIECTKLQFNQRKLKNEERMINLILMRAHGVKQKMGAESAFEDMISYLNRWKKSVKEWQKNSKRRLNELGDMIKVENENNLHEKGKIDEQHRL